LHTLGIRRREDQKTIPSDVELANLRELPPRENLIQSNALYASTSSQYDPYFAALPRIRRDQIMLGDLLGSGAFGKVTNSPLILT